LENIGSKKGKNFLPLLPFMLFLYLVTSPVPFGGYLKACAMSATTGGDESWVAVRLFR
jgi:hypothetical protein